MSNTVNILNPEQTAKKITSLKGRTGTMREDIQSAAIGGLAHAAEHGDFGLLSKLVHAVSAANAAQLRKYVKAFAPARWDGKAGLFKKAKKGGAFRVADALDTYWDAEIQAKKAAESEYDRVKALAKLAKLAETVEAQALEAGDLFALDVVHAMMGAMNDKLAEGETETEAAAA
jgi:hypothetical protein